MPRISTDAHEIALAVPTIDVARLRLLPRAELPPEVSRVFGELVGSVEPDHFREADRPILEELAQAIALQRAATAALHEGGLMTGGELNPLVRVVGAQAGLIARLATRCRLTPQSRLSKDRAAATTGAAVPSPSAALELARRFTQ